MKWYFVGASRSDGELLLELGVKSILISYAYCKSGIPDNLMKAAREKKINLMLDSGAYTNVMKPGSVTFEGYTDFLKSHKDVVTEYVVLDDPKKREVTLENYARMLKAGLDPMIVDHVWFEWASSISKVYSSGKKICWGGLLSNPTGPMKDWASGLTKFSPRNYSQTPGAWLGICRRLAERYKKAVDGKKTHVHLLAVGQRLHRLLPFLNVVDSFDATSWLMSPAFGRVMVYRGADPKTGIPKIGPIHHTALPPEFKSKYKGYDFSKWLDRRKGCVRELVKYYADIESFYARESKKGFQHLWDLCNSKQEQKQKEESLSKAGMAIPISPQFFVPRDLWDMGVLNEEIIQQMARIGDPDIQLAEAIETELSKRVPDPSASTEEKRQRQRERASQYKIEPLDGKGERLTFPAAYPKNEKEYADPVNLMFPLVPDGRAKNARARYKQFADDIYSRTQSKKIVHTRIVERLLAIGASPSYNEEDPLDKLLPEPVKSKMKDRLNQSDEQEKTVKLLPIEKANEEKQIVFGIVLEPDSVDAQGDTIDQETIAVASHLWLARFQNRGLMHEKMINSKVEIYESYLAPTNLTFNGARVKKGSWLLMLHVLDKDLWGDIKSGKLTGFSMGGFARRVRT